MATSAGQTVDTDSVGWSLVKQSNDEKMRVSKCATKY